MLAVGRDEGRVCVIWRGEEEPCYGETVACAGSHEGRTLQVLFGSTVPVFGGYDLGVEDIISMQWWEWYGMKIWVKGALCTSVLHPSTSAPASRRSFTIPIRPPYAMTARYNGVRPAGSFSLTSTGFCINRRVRFSSLSSRIAWNKSGTGGASN